MSETIKIIIVEDNPEYRNVLKMAFELDPDIDLIGIYGSAEHSLRPLEPNSNNNLNPDVLLLDLNLPEMSGLEAMKWFREYIPKTPIIILTQSDSESDVLAAIQNGAMGYLLKSATVQKIKETIETVTRGGALLDNKVAKFILTHIQATPTTGESKISLTDREMEVLELLANGLVKKEIGNALGISFFTVSSHIRHIYDKLNVLNAPAAISTAYQKGILPVQKNREQPPSK